MGNAMQPGAHQGYLTTPVQGFTRTSEWGQRGTRWHHGIDLFAPIGTPLYAAADGTVVASVGNGAQGYADYGETVRIGHSDVETLYAHMNKRFVTTGQSVRQGQQIGEVGDTCGNINTNPNAHMQVTAPHVHFEVLIGPYPSSRGAPDGTAGPIRSMNPRDFFARNGQTLGQDVVAVTKTPGGGVKKNSSWKLWLGISLWGVVGLGVAYALFKKG